MRAVSAAGAFARAWTATYTVGLPHEARDRRREEIASELWEQEHDEAQGMGDHLSTTLGVSVLTRVVRGISADLLWTTGEFQRARRLDLMDLRVDREWDWRIRVIGRVAVIALIALNLPIVVGLPLLFAVTLPMGAIGLVLELRRLQRNREEVGIMTTADIARKRTRRAVALAASVAVFAIGLFVNALPSPGAHDAHWYLFVAPLMIASVAGIIALLMLAWTYVPRQQNEDASSSPTL